MSETIRLERFTIPGRDGLPLRGDVRWREDVERAPVVVVSHGFKGFKDWGFFPTLGERLAAAGYAAVAFNTSGSGIGDDPEQCDQIEQFEHATLSGDLFDLGCILDALLDERLPGARSNGSLALLGHSRGGGVSLIRAVEDRRVDGLVGWASVGTFERFTSDERREWRRRGYTEVTNARTGQVFRLRTDLLDDLEANRERFDLHRIVSGLRVPCLLVHGADDEAVPLAEIDALRAHGAPSVTHYELIAGTGHTFGAVHPFAGTTPALEQAIATTIAFLDDHLHAAS
jgi:dienelactone hydrolase